MSANCKCNSLCCIKCCVFLSPDEIIPHLSKPSILDAYCKSINKSKHTDVSLNNLIAHVHTSRYLLPPSYLHLISYLYNIPLFKNTINKCIEDRSINSIRIINSILSNSTQYFNNIKTLSATISDVLPGVGSLDRFRSKECGILLGILLRNNYNIFTCKLHLESLNTFLFEVFPHLSADTKEQIAIEIDKERRSSIPSIINRAFPNITFTHTSISDQTLRHIRDTNTYSTCTISDCSSEYTSHTISECECTEW